VATDSSGQAITIEGKLEEGFFIFEGVSRGALTGSGGSSGVQMKDMRAACLASMGRMGGEKANELAAVRAFRESDSARVSIVFHPRAHRAGIRKFVVFSDSLSDSGKLKERVYVLPGSPYWAGRFSNGPNWIDYLEAWSEIPVQNHSFGGASVTGPDNISRQNLYALIHDAGQLFVSGSIDHQIEDYQEGFLGGEPLSGVENTAFIIWTGSNDYISKEPFSGAIDTLLNHPLQEGGYQAVVDAVIEASYRQMERIYALGARYILIANMPDLGKTPIVLQNSSYLSGRSEETDGMRRRNLAFRLRELSQYHNQQLTIAIDRFRSGKHDLQLEEFDAGQVFSALLENSLPGPAGERRFDPEFSINTQGRYLQDAGSRQFYQERCYGGGYFGISQSGNICNEVEKLIFWDVIHPTTYAHCWTAYYFGLQMYRAGWILNTPPLNSYKSWCQRISKTMLGHEQIEDILSPPGS